MEQQTTGTVSSNDSAQPSNVADGQQPTNGTAAQDMAQAPALQPKNNKNEIGLSQRLSFCYLL